MKYELICSSSCSDGSLFSNHFTFFILQFKVRKIRLHDWLSRANCHNMYHLPWWCNIQKWVQSKKMLCSEVASCFNRSCVFIQSPITDFSHFYRIPRRYFQFYVTFLFARRLVKLYVIGKLSVERGVHLADVTKRELERIHTTSLNKVNWP